MKFDDILREIGEFGPYQKRIYLCICLPAASVCMFMIVNVVLLATPKHRCKIPGLDNDTYAVQSEGHLSLINATIPPYDGDEHTYDQCHLYVDLNTTQNGNSSTVECHEWVYDTTVFKNTFTKQLNLVCGSRLRVSLAQTIFYFGVLVGSFGFGQMSDIIGRKKTLYISILIILVSSVSLAFVGNFTVFVILLFVVGTCCLGIFMCSYIIGMEFVGPSKRVWAGCIIQLFGTTGAVYVVFVSWLLRDWKYIELAVSLPCVLFIIYWWILPESPRWLQSRGRKEEAESILCAAAKRNGTKLDQDKLDALEVDSSNNYGFWKLFSTRTIAFRTIVIFTNWFIVSMTFYGVVLNVGNLRGDLFFNFFLLSVIEYPAKAISIVLLDRIGRKKLYVCFMILGGLACIGTIFPLIYAEGKVQQNAIITLVVIGKMGAAGGFETLYVLSAEIFPTVVRNVGMGSSSACARVGSMLAPIVAQSAYLVDGIAGKAIPLTLFGAVSFIGGLLSLTLPETLNKKLPDSIQDAKSVTPYDEAENVAVHTLKPTC